MTDPMSELQNVLERLSKKLDDEDDKDKEDSDKADCDCGDCPKCNKKDEDSDKGFPMGDKPMMGDDDEEDSPFPPKKEKPKLDLGGLGEEDDEDDEDEDMMYGDDMTAKGDDMITTDYLNWLERTAKSG